MYVGIFVPNLDAGMSHRESFSNGVKELLILQRKLKRPPERNKVRNLVHTLINESGLQHDPREEYFKLLATCALLGRESMYNNFESKPKRRKHEES
jgi:hypothetical protein